MKKFILSNVLVFIFSGIFSQETIQVMLITGGHAFDTIPFFEMFDDMERVEYQHFEQPVANQTIANGLVGNFDVLVFYDMWQDITPNEKSAYLQLTKTGKPFLFLHHSLVSYQNWEEFEKIIGGKYIEKAPDIPESEQSNYEHDVWIDIQTIGNHPSTKGFEGLRFFDEVYGNTRVSETIVPILTTKHPKSNKIIGWENQYNSSKIVYIQPGHDYHTYEKEDYRKLLQQTIFYLAGID